MTRSYAASWSPRLDGVPRDVLGTAAGGVGEIVEGAPQRRVERDGERGRTGTGGGL